MKVTFNFNLIPDEIKEDLTTVEFDMSNPAHQKVVEKLASAKLDFDLGDYENDDRGAFLRAAKADRAFSALWEIAQNVFRPARKHGYSNPELNQMIDDCGDYYNKEYGCECGRGAEVISQLEDMFYRILEEEGVNLDEDCFL